MEKEKEFGCFENLCIQSMVELIYRDNLFSNRFSNFNYDFYDFQYV